MSEKQRGRGAGTQIHGHTQVTHRRLRHHCDASSSSLRERVHQRGRDRESDRETELSLCPCPKRAATHGLPSPHSLCLSAGLYPSASAAGSASACGPSAPLYLPLFPSVSVRHLQTTVRSATERERKRERERDRQSPAGYTQEGDHPPHLPLSGSAVPGRKRPYSPSLSVSRSLSHTHTPPWEDKSYQAFFLAAVPSASGSPALSLSPLASCLSLSSPSACLACLSLSLLLSLLLSLSHTPPTCVERNGVQVRDGVVCVRGGGGYRKRATTSSRVTRGSRLCVCPRSRTSP